MYPPQGYQQPFPPTKKPGGCLPMLLIVGGLAVAIIVLGILAGIAKGPQLEESERKRAKEAADVADAAAQKEAADRAVLEADWRKGCKLPSSAPVFVAYNTEIRERCEGMVRESLKVPGSGSFPSLREQATDLVSDDRCNRTFASYFDAQNAFGVKVRTRYECTFDPRTGLYSLKTH